MRQFLTLLAAFVIFQGCDPDCPDCPNRCQAQGVVREMVPLPNIEGAYWTTFIDDGSPYARRLSVHLASDPVLSDLIRHKTRFVHRPANDPFFMEKLRTSVGAAPCFMLQTPDGGIIYRVNGPDVPATGIAMVDDLKRHVAKWKSMGQPKVCNLCPRPKPPSPPDDSVKPIDDVLPDEDTPAGEFPWWVWVAGCCGAFVGGFGLHYLRDRK